MKIIDKVYNLIGYWEQDNWDLLNCGLDNITNCLKYKVTSYRYIDFSKITNVDVKKEVKYYIFTQLFSFEGTFNTLRQKHLYLFKWFIKYLNESKLGLNSLAHINKKIEEDYIEFFKVNNVKTKYRKDKYHQKTCRYKLVLFQYKIKRFFIDVYNEQLNKEPDTWYVKDFNISSHRVNLSGHIKTFKFYRIENEKNKDIFKRYMKHLLLNTEISISFMSVKFSGVRLFLEFLGEKNVAELERCDIEEYKKKLLNMDISNNTFNVRLLAVSDFLKFGVNKGILDYNHVYIEFDILDTSFKFNGNIVEQQVIEQILKNADKIPKKFLAMFLILYCCGMRISEVCTLKVGCLKKDDIGHYIVFYQQKMKKEVSNPIPKNLYELLMDQQQQILSSYGENQIYLFPKKDGLPTIANTYKNQMEKILKDLDIRNSDGSIYIFRPHEYRHTFATNLLDKEVPFTVIQKLLHHNSPEMSLVYTQLTDSRKRKKYMEFVNLVGNKSNILFENNKEIEEIYEVQWLKKNLKAQALPNGYCSLPVSLGQCPYANKCLLCEHFRTTKGHLKILKKQLIRTNQLIEILNERKMTQQLEINFKVKDNLIRVISSIEEGD